MIVIFRIPFVYKGEIFTPKFPQGALLGFQDLMRTKNIPSKFYETHHLYLRIVNGSVDLAGLKVSGYFKHDA